MATFPIPVNSIVHIVMYSYYLLSLNKNTSVQKVLNIIKPYITIMQMVSDIISIEIHSDPGTFLDYVRLTFAFKISGPILHHYFTRASSFPSKLFSTCLSRICVYTQCFSYLLLVLWLLQCKLQEFLKCKKEKESRKSFLDHKMLRKNKAHSNFFFKPRVDFFPSIIRLYD